MKKTEFVPDMAMLGELMVCRKKIEHAVEAAQTGNMDLLQTYTPEEFAEDLAHHFLTTPSKILKYLTDETLTYPRFATILIGRSNAAYFKREGYVDADIFPTLKGIEYSMKKEAEFDQVMSEDDGEI